MILGTGVHAAELVEIVERINGVEKTWNLLGFIGRHDEEVGRELNGTPVLGTFHAPPRLAGAVVYAAANHNKLPSPLAIERDRLVSLVDPTAFVSRSATLGRGCVIYPGCFVGLQARLGDLVFLLAGSVLNHDVVVEDRVIVTSGVSLAGGVQVGEGSYLGQSCTVREKLRLGKGCLVGMGAVVVGDVRPGTVVAGNPAREIRERRAGE